MLVTTKNDEGNDVREAERLLKRKGEKSLIVTDNHRLSAISRRNGSMTKKLRMLVTTKNDEGNDIFVREAERLLNRKGEKSPISPNNNQ